MRYSVEYPRKYIDSNINAFFNLIEEVKKKKTIKFFYASSSSVYGDLKKFPLKEKNYLFPTNTYSLSKKFNEDLAKIYSKFYGIKAIGLRFFTVYGEWGRPDMFYSKILNSAFGRSKLFVNNYGNHYRDFTYIQDVNKILFNLLKIKQINSLGVINICSNKPVNILRLIKLFENNSKKIKIYKRPIQQADVYKTHGDNSLVKKFKLIKNFTDLETGVENTINWYKKYYKKH